MSGPTEVEDEEHEQRFERVAAIDVAKASADTNEPGDRRIPLDCQNQYYSPGL